MCGISGVISVDRAREFEGWLANSKSLLCHRGPDGEGEWWSVDNRVGFAHRRLAVVELSELGHQPMQRGVDGPQIVFNGEIYNHRELREELSALGHSFRSTSDTEVLLAAYETWGYRCLERLNGMFAFALFDQSKQSVFFARDRAGEKPLFYHKAGRTLFFASDLGVLLRNRNLQRDVNQESLNYYLAYGYAPGESTLVTGFNKLPAAHAMTMDLNSGDLKMWRYWELPAERPASEVSQEALVDELDTILDSSVKRQLEADVPVGVLLSGGLDSSLVTAMASRHSAKLKTFTVAIESDSKLDETEFAQAIANHFGTDHTVLPAESITAKLVESIAKGMGEPLADSSLVPTFLVTREIRKTCTVAIGGDGGDEMFGGYGHYPQALNWAHNRGFTPGILTDATSRLSRKLLPVGFPGRNLLANLNFDLDSGVFTSATHFDSDSRLKLFRGTPGEVHDSEGLRLSRVPSRGSSVGNFTASDFETYFSEDILVKVDRASMMNSLEVRAPFLDKELLEFAFARVPSELKATRSQKKILPKLLGRRLFPADFDLNRKQGFSIPLSAWLKSGEIRSLVWDTLTADETLLNKRAIAQILRNQDLGFRNSERIFSLFQFEVWRQEFGVSWG